MKHRTASKTLPKHPDLQQRDEIQMEQYKVVKGNKLDAERQRLETEELHRQLREMKAEKEKLQKLEKRCQSHLDTARQEKEALETEIHRKQKENIRLQNENVTCEAELKKTKTDLERVEMEKKDMENANIQLQADLDGRLSALASGKLLDPNPNIADLSDANRPTKLAEKFSELYDNEWTEAFTDVQSLQNFKDEEKTVTFLLKVLKIAYSMAMKAAEDQLFGMKKTLEVFFHYDDTLVNGVTKQLKESRKKIIVPSKALTKAYYHALEKQEPEDAKMLLGLKTLERYMDECLQICWLMGFQDPPLYFHTDGCRKGDKFDRNSFKEYTQGGDVVDFAVWPALYLHKNGALLAKGVVQCEKDAR